MRHEAARLRRLDTTNQGLISVFNFSAKVSLITISKTEIPFAGNHRCAIKAYPRLDHVIIH